MYCAVDVTTELTIIILSMYLVTHLTIAFPRKIAVVACFAPRTLVIAAALVRLAWLAPITPHDNPQFRLWLPTIFTQIHVCLSVCTASIPYMVPYFRSLEGGARRSLQAKRSDMDLDEDDEPSKSVGWFRRRASVKRYHSWDSAEVLDSHYERVPQASPHVATPRPMSPMTPPQAHTPPSRSPSQRGLCISIPMADYQRHSGSTSPRTESSFALSPTCPSPQPLLAFIPSRKAPTPPFGTPNSNTNLHADADSGRIHSQEMPTQRFSLFPPQRAKSRSPQPSQRSFPSPTLVAVRNGRSQTISSTPRQSVYSRSPETSVSAQYYSRSSSTAPLANSSTAPQSRSPPPTSIQTNTQLRPASVQDLTSPMGAAINNWFTSDTPRTTPQPRAKNPLSAEQQRNQQVLSSSNSTRSPAAPLPTASRSPKPQDVLRDELFLPRDSILMSRPSRSHTMPSIRDVRSSPSIVVQSPV